MTTNTPTDAELIERLRERETEHLAHIRGMADEQAERFNYSSEAREGAFAALCEQAAIVVNFRDFRATLDRLTSLSAQIEELRAALEPFAHYFDTNDCDERQGNIEVPISDLRRARQALGDHRHD